MIRAAAATAVVLSALTVAPARAQAYNPGDNAASSQTPAAAFEPPAADEGVRFTGKHAYRSLNCRGGDAMVSGDANELKLSDCSRLTVTGARNRISVFLSSPGDITVTGAHNAVRYHSPDDGAPRVTDSGADNDVRPAAG